MTEYIDKSALYEKIAQIEELAMNRYLEAPSNSPCCSRYMEQLNERTAFKHIIADFPSADVAPVRHGRWEKQSGLYSCSECGKTCPYDVQADVIEYWACNYCPSCGAKMDGGVD